MRVLYLVGALGRGGADLRVAQLARLMRQRWHEAALLTYPRSTALLLIEALLRGAQAGGGAPVPFGG